MQLDERSMIILSDITLGFRKSYKELEDKYGWSKRQIGYSLKKINMYLEEQGVPLIQKSREGNLLVDSETKRLLEHSTHVEKKQQYIFSEFDRMQIIAFMICVMEEELSLQHFVSELDVSKNTILSDLKNVRELFDFHGQKLIYTRQSGYVVEGNEFEIRKILLETVSQIMRIPGGSKILFSISGLTQASVSIFKRWMIITETELEVTFTDEKMMITPYCLAIIYQRIKKGYYLQKEELICEELYDTKEYAQASRLLAGLKNVPKQERFYIALLILSSNVSDNGVLSENKIVILRSAIEKIVDNFENRACVKLQDKGLLIDMLLQHLRPAYYRMKYNLTLTGNLLDVVNVEMYEEELQEIHIILKGCVTPLEALIGREIPEIELKFLTLFIGSWFRRQGTKISDRPKVVVVCPNGITVSKVMFASLKNLFPEFLFLDSVSIREFHEWDENLYDIVFAPLVLKTNKKMFVVEPVMAQKDKSALRKQVLEEIFGIATADYQLEEIIKIVENSANIMNRKQLEKQLKKYFFGKIVNPDIAQEIDKEYDLTDLLPETHIRQMESVTDWKEAMEITAEPLLRDGNVSLEYVQKVLTQYDDKSIHIVFGGQIAVPHAMPQNDVYRLGMSMLSVKEGVMFAGLKIHLFVMLAPVDEKQHLKAILQLSKIAENEKDIQKIVDCKNPLEIKETIKNMIGS